jgi:carbon-monoxide dehydrogenase large subunit
MTIRVEDESLATIKSAVGQPVLRNEDQKLLRGQGSYTDDISLPGELHMAMVRSPYAHGLLRGIDVSTARDMPGVVAIYTGADLAAAGYGPFPYRVALTNRDGTPLVKPVRHALAIDKVSFAGDAIACVIAETAEQAQDAAEAVELDIEQLPAVIDVREAVKRGEKQYRTRLSFR